MGCVFFGEACFLDVGTIFLDPYSRVFFWAWGHRKCRGRACAFSWPGGDTLLDLHVFVLDPGIFFTTAKLIVSDLGFFFLVPCTCFVDLASIRVGGGNSIVICAHIGLDVFGPWHLFFGPAHVFFGPGAGWREFRYWDQMHARRCWEKGGTCRYWSQMSAENWWERGRWEGEVRHRNKMSARSCWDEKGKPRYWTQTTAHARRCGETRAWMRELLRGNIETKWRCMQKVVKRPEGQSCWDQVNESRKLLRGTRGGSLDIETRWMPKAGRGVKSRNWEEGRMGRRH